MPTLMYGAAEMADFSSLAHSPFDLASPYRSTVPLLAFWADPATRFPKWANAVGISDDPGSDLVFEYTVAPAAGSGKPSHTDLMVLTREAAVAVEAKYTEPKYPAVSNWLGVPATENRQAVLNGWLQMIGVATGAVLDSESVLALPYQLVHRTASACAPTAVRRAVVYHCFDPSEADCDYYSEQLGNLANLIGRSPAISFYLCITTLKKTSRYAALQADWLLRRPRPDVSLEVRRMLLEHDVAEFSDPEIVRF